MREIPKEKKRRANILVYKKLILTILPSILVVTDLDVSRHIQSATSHMERRKHRVHQLYFDPLSMHSIVLTAPFIYCKKYSKVIEMVGFSCHEIQLVFSWLLR
jgi:hypothetical protein